MDNKRLLIRVASGALSFSTTQESGVIYEPYPLNSSISMAANMREALRTVPLLGETFHRVWVMVDAPVLMVPLSQFREAELETLYSHALTPREQQTVMHHMLPNLDTAAVFTVPKDLCTVLRDAFSDVRFLPVMSPVWHHFHERSFTGQHQKLYGYFHDRRMDVFCFSQNRFRFSNSFAVNSPNDAMYYLLATWKQVGMDAEHDELHLAGDIQEREALLDEARRFIKRVFFTNPSGEFNRAPVTQISGIPYDLVALYMKGR